jgi:sensor histidine kinase YesM
MSERRSLPVPVQVLLWAAGNSLAGATIGLAVGLFQEEGIESPVVLISILFGNVVGFAVLISSVLLFPRIRALGPWAGGALLVLSLVGDSIAGSLLVVLFFPLFVLRDLAQVGAIVAINVVLALVVGIVVYVYEGLRLRLSESLREVEEVRLVEARLREAAARAELAALQARINPHFFFNTLNTISSLLEDDPERAEEVLQTLADLFRYTLKASDATLVPLSEELAFVRHYLTIEQARFGDRLHVDWDVADDAGRTPVPGLILQPLVENAVAHGVGPRSSGGTVRISARVESGRLEIEVRDDGVGLGEGFSGELREGHGLSNVRRRLRSLYGPDGDLVLEADEREGGAVARMTLPGGV